MGCHLWLYKKLKDLSKEEMLEKINSMKSRTSDEMEESLEEYVNSIVTLNQEELKRLQPKVDSGEIKPGDYEYDVEYEISKEYSDPEIVTKIYNETVEEINLRKQKYAEFLENPSPSDQDFYELVSLYSSFGVDLKEHKGEWYYEKAFDTYFRCFVYHEDKIDNYEDCIKYLESADPNMIHQYGDFTEDGKFRYFDCETYEPKKGLTDDLKKMLKFLFKDNDIFMEFG